MLLFLTLPLSNCNAAACGISHRCNCDVASQTTHVRTKCICHTWSETSVLTDSILHHMLILRGTYREVIECYTGQWVQPACVRPHIRQRVASAVKCLLIVIVLIVDVGAVVRHSADTIHVVGIYFHILRLRSALRKRTPCGIEAFAGSISHSQQFLHNVRIQHAITAGMRGVRWWESLTSQGSGSFLLEASDSLVNSAPNPK